MEHDVTIFLRLTMRRMRLRFCADINSRLAYHAKGYGTNISLFNMYSRRQKVLNTKLGELVKTLVCSIKSEQKTSNDETMYVGALKSN
jgi:hypothetical protein